MQPSFLAAISAVVNLSTANYLRTRQQTDSSNWTTTEWSDTFKHRVIDGHARFRAILNANTDQSSSCAIGDWAITQNPRQPRDGGLVNIWSNAGLSMAENLYSVSAQYPRDAGSGQQANFSDFYDPTNGLVVTVNNTNAANLNAPINAGDVVWEIYKATARDSGSQDYNSLKAVLSLNVQSNTSAEIFQELWDTAPDAQRQMSILEFPEPASDQAMALLGLDDGAFLSDFLSQHNAEFGHKSINSTYVYKDGQKATNGPQMWQSRNISNAPRFGQPVYWRVFIFVLKHNCVKKALDPGACQT